MKWFQKERLVQAGFVVGGILLYVILTYTSEADLVIDEKGRISRGGYGGDGSVYEILVESELEGQKIQWPMAISVDSQKYGKQEAEQVFAEVMAGMETRICGQNPSLMEVSQNLELPKLLEDQGVRLRWYSSDPEILDSAGNVVCDVKASRDLTLFVQLKAGDYSADYEIPVRVIPEWKGEKEAFFAEFQEEVGRLDEEQKYDSYLQLPSEYQGRKLRYQTEEHSGYGILPLLGIVLAVVWPARKQSEQKKREKNREQELLLDYAELVSKMMILIGAGMTLRNAWERMVLDYEAGLIQKEKTEESGYRRNVRKRGGNQKKTRAAYEEMRYTWHQIRNGVSEGQAYRDFGQRCRLQPYLKLSSLLEQNRRTGTKDLRKLLQIELTDAFELRKNMARRMGEEAGTKLLVPLFLMLGIVMVMIMVPAMMTMG